MNATTCPNCSKEVAPGTQFCLHCGFNLAGAAPQGVVPQPGMAPGGALPVNRKSKSTAGILAILLGGLGIHKFYLGQGGMGLLYLLFFWTYIPAIIGFIEGIMYLGMSEQDFYNKYH